MNKKLMTPKQAWDELVSFWSPFSFMLVPGASAKQIQDFQIREDVILQPRLRELISIYSAFDIPAGYNLDFCAEATLYTIDTWVRFDKSSMNTIMDDPDWWPDIFRKNNCPSTLMKDYIVIGSNPWGADYGFYVMLHQSSNTVFSIDENIPEIKPMGDIVTWLAENRLGDLKNAKAYVDSYNKESDNGGGAGISKENRFYLELGYPEALARWEKVESKFISTFDGISTMEAASAGKIEKAAGLQ
ncbi:hypothetical protein [Ancylomarina sp.]|uniref:hypothetical protein n=1 Tax=Ancylomarina sp. TaxID=1970196 RepID=UPI003567D8BC